MSEEVEVPIVGSEIRIGSSSPITSPPQFRLRVPCHAPAPAVVNGHIFAGCDLDRGHEGEHRLVLEWSG